MSLVVSPKFQNYSFTQSSQKCPECIVTKYSLITPSGPLNIYRMADTKRCEVVGEMIARPVTETMFSNYYPIVANYDSFKIESLKIEDQRQGYGTKFVNFAKNESEKLGCGGKIHLDASRVYAPKNPPHIFYRKNGFTSRDTIKIAYIDKCIKEHKKMSLDMADNLAMYLPVEKDVKSKNFKSVFIDLFKKIFK